VALAELVEADASLSERVGMADFCLLKYLIWKAKLCLQMHIINVLSCAIVVKTIEGCN